MESTTSIRYEREINRPGYNQNFQSYPVPVGENLEAAIRFLRYPTSAKKRSG
ncbi:hypothetical protein K458DRAFT_366853 [Lentithecium fluviatile CBS 122367]|uniref:Uncharacterized protein n=1 Tax=Lentithecium fluviatile CBS 122367 TaxID=1168545 RepID=A0A6G1J2N5_9PLEO|nr:hypothetical protein K458DRAFT_366853 [Lentithecium fluviatile CBS 122367]